MKWFLHSVMYYLLHVLEITFYIVIVLLFPSVQRKMNENNTVSVQANENDENIIQ